MSRARDMANLGAQAGSGLDASDITTGTLGNTVQDNITRLGTVTAGQFDGIVGDAHTQPNTDWIYGKLNADHNVSSYTMINLSGTTTPYVSWSGSIASFGDGGGSSVTGTTEHDLKFRTKGIYYILVSATFAGTSAGESRQTYLTIRGSGSTSESGTTLAESTDQVANTASSHTDYGNSACFYTGLFNANDQINIQAYSAGSLLIHATSHITVFKLRSVP